jgi:hypothetical protein
VTTVLTVAVALLVGLVIVAAVASIDRSPVSGVSLLDSLLDEIKADGRCRATFSDQEDRCELDYGHEGPHEGGPFIWRNDS